MRKLFLALSISCSLFSNEDTEQVFTTIYRKGFWGYNEEGVGFSGAGSTVANTNDYVVFLQNFIRENNIKTVVDAGCGDWTFSKNVDWSGIKYLGVDVVESVVKENNEKYGSENIRFEHFDIIRYELPAADLLICKDVLMHLPNLKILFFLKSTKRFKHCLFTNNIGGENQNHDIQQGEFRPLDLRGPPFYLNGINIFTYSTDHGDKQVLYHGN